MNLCGNSRTRRTPRADKALADVAGGVTRQSARDVPRGSV